MGSLSFPVFVQHSYGMRLIITARLSLTKCWQSCLPSHGVTVQVHPSASRIASCAHHDCSFSVSEFSFLEFKGASDTRELHNHNMKLS